jgi:uncharacterized cupin superfamily protein
MSRILLLSISACLTFFCLPTSAEVMAVSLPSLLSKQDLATDITNYPEVVVENRDNDSQAYDAISMLSSDKKFVTGMYAAPAGRFEYANPYGVDEYMYFLEGSVTLTSSDGSVMKIMAGDSVTLAKEWTGVWETKGYKKLYVIYSPDEPFE